MLRNPGYAGHNAVFLTIRLVMESSLIKGASSFGSAVPNVKQIRIKPFTIEHEQAAAYFGNHIELLKSKDYVGPVVSQWRSLLHEKRWIYILS